MAIVSPGKDEKIHVQVSLAHTPIFSSNTEATDARLIYGDVYKNPNGDPKTVIEDEV